MSLFNQLTETLFEAEASDIETCETVSYLVGLIPPNDRHPAILLTMGKLPAFRARVMLNTPASNIQQACHIIKRYDVPSNGDYQADIVARAAKLLTVLHFLETA